MSKNKIRNAHCTYYEGQTGLCKAKEFVKCNPVNCKLYTIDELSTILDLQEQLNHKEQECEELKTQTSNFMNGEYCANGCKKMHKQFKKVHNNLVEENKKLKQECEELKENNYNLNMSMYQYRSTQKENDRYKQALDEIEEYINSFPDFVKEADKIILDIINKAKE